MKMTCIAEGAEGDLSMDLIDRQAAIDALEREKTYCSAFREGYSKTDIFEKYNMGLTDGIKAIKNVPSAQPDFSCDGCKTPKHICGICMRNYPNITDHYCTGEWAERREE